MGNTGCFQCVAEYKVALDKMSPEEREEQEPLLRAELREADTWVPVWQQQNIMGQVVLACVSLPTCIPHITAREKTAEEKAVEGGKLLPGARRVDGDPGLRSRN